MNLIQKKIRIKKHAGVAERGVYSLETSCILDRGCNRKGHREGNQPFLRHRIIANINDSLEYL